MTKAKSTKRALLMSGLALIMCVSMLVGSTFAWFTDSVTSAGNIIKSGTLDVTMEWADGTKAVPAVDSTDWTDASQGAIFNSTLWEPGYTEVRHIKIANEGTLALKYQLNIIANGEVSKLADVIDVYYVDPAVQVADRTALTDNNKLGTLSAVLEQINTTASGNLKAKENHTITLALKMQESAGNEYQNLAIGSDVSIQLLATQLTSEFDSFDNQYDKDADYAIVVKDAAELIKAIETVEDGGIIALNADVTFDANTATNSGGSWYEGIYYTGDKSFTIDLGGKTITNDSAVNDYLMLFKNDGDKANTITLRNGTIEAGSSAYCAICTSSASTQTITIDLENVNVIGNNSNGSVAKIRGGAVLNVKHGTVITGKDSYLGIESANSTVNIYDGAEIYQNGSSSYNGCLVGVGSNGIVNVYGGYGKGVAGGFIAMTSGGTINVYGGEWIADTDGTFSGNDNVLIAQSDKASYAGAGNSVVNVYGGTFNGTYNCYGNVAGDAQINIVGGNFTTDPSAYVFAGCEVTKNNGVWTVQKVAEAVSDAASLVAAIENAEDGDVIVFAKDITTVDGSVIADKKITLDLNGKTFSVSEGANTSNRNFLINGSSVVTIKNGTLVASGDMTSGAYGTIRTEGTASVTLENMKLYNYRGNGLNVKALEGTTVTINNTEIYSQYGGGVEAAGGVVELNNVKIEQKGMWTAPYNSMAVSVNGGGKAIINGGTYTTECLTAEEANGQGSSHGPWTIGVLNSGGTLVVNDGTFSNDNFGDNSLAKNARGLVLADTGAVIEINGGTFNAVKAIVDVTNNLGDVTRNPSVTLAGGTFSADPKVSGLYASELIKVADGFTVTENGGTYTVAAN